MFRKWPPFIHLLSRQQNRGQSSVNKVVLLPLRVKVRREGVFFTRGRPRRRPTLFQQQRGFVGQTPAAAKNTPITACSRHRSLDTTRQTSPSVTRRHVTNHVTCRDTPTQGATVRQPTAAQKTPVLAAARKPQTAVFPPLRRLSSPPSSPPTLHRCRRHASVADDRPEQRCHTVLTTTTGEPTPVSLLIRTEMDVSSAGINVSSTGIRWRQMASMCEGGGANKVGR